MAGDQSYTAKDAKDLAGLTYRQLNDWASRGAMPNEDGRDGGWRKFSLRELFALMVGNEIRTRYGIPVERIRYVLDYMATEGANHFEAAVQLMSLGLHVYLLTDFEHTFVMDSDLEFTDLMQHGYFRADETRPFIFMQLNEIANRLLGVLEKPIHLKAETTGRLYRVKAEGDASITVRNQPEIDLLHAIRSGKFDQISVSLKGSDIHEIHSERDVAAEDLRDTGGTVSVRSSDFETVTLTKANGVVVRARSKLPRKYSAADNEPMFFAGIHGKRPQKPGRRK
jgi:DNA-binding transcriptional MerR regulator